MRRAGQSTSSRNGRFGRPQIALALLLAVALAGCGEAARRADAYRVQKGLWEAYRAGQAMEIAGTAPDTNTILALRQRFIDAVEVAYPLLEKRPSGAKRSAAEVRLLQIVSQGEIEAARLAHAAGHPELALERCKRLVAVAEGDTSVTRRADIMIAGSLRRMGKHEEAIDVMKTMMVRYPPRAPDSTGVEDFVLSLPIVVVDLRKDMGDEAGTARALAEAERYYQGLILGGGMAPALEAQVRSRLIHVMLEQKRTAEVYAGLDSLESIVSRTPSLAPMIPEIRYTRFKLKAAAGEDIPETIGELERLAFIFPNSGVAPRALFDAAVLMERSNRFAEAREAYARIPARFPNIPELAATSLLRQAMLEDRAGDWAKSKATLESVPANYPRTTAAAQAPLSIVEHYVRVGDRAGVDVSLKKAAEQYERMVRSDSTAAGAARVRWNLLRCYLQLRDRDGVFRTVDGLVDRHPKTPFAAEALLQGANFAETNNLKPVAVRFLGRYLQEFPNAPQAKTVRERVRKLTQ